MNIQITDSERMADIEYGDYPDLCEVVQEERTIVQKYWKAV